MPKKEGKFKSEDGKQTMTVTIDDVHAPEQEPPTGDTDVEAYQLTSSETFRIVSGDRVLTITIAE